MKSLIAQLTLVLCIVFLVDKTQALDAFYLPYTKHLAPCYMECINGKYHEQNHVTGITNGKYAGFVMKNSYNRFSVFGGRQFTKRLTPSVKAFIAVGGVTGYTKVSTSRLGIAPAGYIGVDIHKSGSPFGVVITGVPTKEGEYNIGFRYSF